MSLNKTKKGLALSLVIIGVIGIVILVILVILVNSEFSRLDSRYDKMYDKDCRSVGGECVAEYECLTPARVVFDESLIECENEVKTYTFKPEEETRNIGGVTFSKGSGTSTSKNICCLQKR